MHFIDLYLHKINRYQTQEKKAGVQRTIVYYEHRPSVKQTQQSDVTSISLFLSRTLLHYASITATVKSLTDVTDAVV